jgi:hypothetical protein
MQAVHNEFWWYFNGLAPWRGFSRPFVDDTGRWWYRVKPGFAWPVNFFDALKQQPTGREFRSLLGWQYPVEQEDAADSAVRMNVIERLDEYEIRSLPDAKRRAIRRGVRNLEVVVIDSADKATAIAAHEVWKSHVSRTGWNAPLSKDRFLYSWEELSRWPGTTVLAARVPSTRLICAWMIARVVDEVIYIDTLASHTDRLEHRPNDFIAFAALTAAKLQGTRRAHYSLASNKSSLETFKQSLGFEARAFPSRLHLRPGIGLALRLLRPGAYRRLLGLEEPIATEAPS